VGVPEIGRGSRVLVTGASGGFGEPTVARLREIGAEVVGLDRVAAPGGVLACDVTDDGAVADAVGQAVDRLGGLDAVVHFAGIGTPNDAGGPLEPDAMRVLDVNLLGAWRVTAAALPALLDGAARRGGRGRVVFVASELAYLTLPFVSAYSVAKRGMSAYADALRVEYGTELAVTTVYPGYVRTPIHDEGRAAGLALEGQVRREEVDDIVGTVLRALTSARPRRDTAGSALGGVELWAGRHLPGLLDRVVARRLRSRAEAGHFDSAPAAAGLVRRLTGRSVPAVADVADAAPAARRSA
jgi:NAD(P)-dependent dehydrogenase (short-subunit alcohol dehydrogenase family)